MKPNEIINDMKKSTLDDMARKNKELFDIIRPINGGMIKHGGKPTYKMKEKFMQNGDFEKAHKLIFNIIEGHKYLVQFY